MPPVTIITPPKSRRRRRAAPSVALPLRIALLALVLFALSLSVYLSWIALTGRALPGCTNESTFGCSEVLTSGWSKWFGLPVALPAASLYAGLLVSLVFTFAFVPPAVRDVAWRVVAALGLMAGLAAVWFIALQGLVVKHWCPYCMGVHLTGLVLCGLVFGLVYAARRKPGLLAGFAATGLSLLIVGQVVSEDTPTYTTRRVPSSVEPVQTGDPTGGSSQVGGDSQQTGDDVPALDADPDMTPRDIAPPPRQRLMTIVDHHPPIDLYTMPVLGSPDAEYVIVELFDYTCPVCRKMAPRLEAVRERYGDQLAIVVITNPMHPDCNHYFQNLNPVHRYACTLALYSWAVWQARPELFEEYHHWLMEGDTPTPQAAFERASEMIGIEPLLAQVGDEANDERIQVGVELYKALSLGKIPKLIIGTQLHEGPVASEEELFSLIEEELHIQPVP